MATITLSTAPLFAGIGDKVTLTAQVKDDTGTLTAATMAVAVTKPDATSASPSAPATSQTGIYTSSLTVDQSGVWTYVWTASGAQVAVESDQFEVRAQQVYVVSLEELKKQLNRTDDADDLELRTYLASATKYVQYRIGGPVSVQTFTERHFVSGEFLIPRKRPLVSVTSITPDFGTALATSSYVADTEMNRVLFYYTPGGWHTIVYKAGLAQPDENVKLAGMIVAQHLWQTQNGGGGLPYPGDTDVFVPSMGFAVPRRAEELLGVGDAISGVS